MKKIFFLLLFSTIVLNGFTQKTIVLSDTTKIISIGKLVDLYEDKTGTLNFEQISSPEFKKKFKQSEQEVPNYGTTNSAIWCRMKFKNESQMKWVLEIGNAYLDTVEFYFNTENGIEKKRAGKCLPYNQREIKTTYFLFNIPINKNAEAIVYVKVKNFIGIIPLRVGTMQPMLESANRLNTFFGFYFGVLFVIFLINLVLYFALKQTDLLYYITWVGITGIYSAIYKGYLTQLLPDSFAVISEYGTAILGLGSIFILLFASSFLRFKTLAPLFYKSIFFMISIIVVDILIYISGYHSIGSTILQFIALSFVFITVFFAYIIYRRGYKPARFFLLAFSVSLGSFFIYGCLLRGWIGYNFYTGNSFILGSFWEVIFLTLANADKINFFRRENERLVIEQNVILEQKVEERTHELKESQSQLVSQEKLASLGQLTAGIAHEIQNPLNFVNNFSDMSSELFTQLDDAKTEEEKKEILKDLKDNFEKINHHGKRADGIIKAMLMHSRGKVGEKNPFNLNLICSEIIKLVYKNEVIKNPDFHCNIYKYFDENIKEITAVQSDLTRVLVNLISNAMYAVKEKADGEVTISTSLTPALSGGEGGKIQIKIRDNGTGISDEIKQKIFEPFFTTKPTNEGTGLGLSISYDIIKSHGGDIKVESIENEFTEFFITLPV